MSKNLVREKQAVEPPQRDWQRIPGDCRQENQEA